MGGHIEADPATCAHPMTRIVYRGGADVWCWVCRDEPDRPRHLRPDEARQVIARIDAVDRRLGGIVT